MTITRDYTTKLFNAINKLENECSIDDYDQRRQIENMRVEYFGLVNDDVLRPARIKYFRKAQSITTVKYIQNA